MIKSNIQISHDIIFGNSLWDQWYIPNSICLFSTTKVERLESSCIRNLWIHIPESYNFKWINVAIRPYKKYAGITITWCFPPMFSATPRYNTYAACGYMDMDLTYHLVEGLRYCFCSAGYCSVLICCERKIILVGWNRMDFRLFFALFFNHQLLSVIPFHSFYGPYWLP